MLRSKVGVPNGGRQVASPPTERVIAVMQLLAADPDRALSLTHIARTLQISPATTHAILNTLTAHRWAVRNSRTNGYCWGPAMGALTKTAGDRHLHVYLQELHETTGVQVFVARRESATLTVVDSIGGSLNAPQLRAGLRLPLVAPFGRDYVAWAGENVQAMWLDGISEPSSALGERLTAVLEEIRRRGFVIERMSREYVRVYAALRALADDGEADAITTRLAAAFADLTLVDYLPGELDERRSNPIATVSAPVKDCDGVVTMSVTAAPLAELAKTELDDLAAQVRSTAAQIESALA